MNDAGDGGPSRPDPTSLRAALRVHFTVDRGRVPVVAAAALAFVLTRAATGPSSALALATGLWCGYCLAFCGVAALARVGGGSSHDVAIAVGVALTVMAGAVVGRGVEAMLWTVHDSAWPEQAVRVAEHGVFVGALTLVPMTRSVAAARRHARSEAERTRLTGRLLALQAQIEPHFLFNTLATLRSLIRRDASAAVQLLDRMTAFLRAVIPDTRQASSTIGREVDIVDAYLAIMRVRLGDRLRYAMQIAPDSALACIPPLLLQPLVENAIKHGIEPSETGGLLDLRTAIDGAFVVIEVRNTGRMLCAAAVDDQRVRTGLRNIRERLAALHPQDGSLTLRTEAQTTVARIRMPFVTAR